MRLGDRDAAPPDRAVWTVIGGGGAIALGAAMIPLRSLTVASNLAFVFLLLTIVIAEVGGRAAGLVTAVASALSLNFFLTTPYLTLTIDRPDDIIAFVVLAVSGVVAAGFGRRRARSAALLDRAREVLHALGRAAAGLAEGTPLTGPLDALRDAFHLDGVVVRERDGRLLAAVPPAAGGRPAPTVALDPRTLLGTDERQHRIGRRGLRLPEGGGRLRLGVGPEPLWLDLWEGDADGLSMDEHRALTVAVALLGLALCRIPTRAGSR